MARKPARKASAADIEMMRSLRASGKELMDICKITGFGYGTVQKHCEDVSTRGGEGDGTRVGWSISGDEATYTGITDKPIKTEADAIEASNPQNRPCSALLCCKKS